MPPRLEVFPTMKNSPRPRHQDAFAKIRPAFQRAFLTMVCLLTAGIAKSQDAVSPPGWKPLRQVKMSGLRAFWDVNGALPHRDEAIRHGFSPVLLMNDYSDNPGKNKRNILTFLRNQHAPSNPWDRPEYFEEIIRQNFGLAVRDADVRMTKSSIFVHDIEFDFEQDIAKAWADPAARKASGAKTMEEFEELYLAKWAEWLWLPCKWGKEVFPDLRTGLYGPQPFRRDFWGIAGKDAKQIDGTHRLDDKLWKYIDPHVDFYIASIYLFYDGPESLYYIASNIEENYNRTRQYGNKPVLAYSWLRYHNSNAALENRELDPWLADAMAVIPYFYGAQGNALWGWEPKTNDKEIYQVLPVFMDSLGRVADLSRKIATAEPADDDELAHVLWKAKKPMVRRLKVRGDKEEWIVLAANPWQGADENSKIKIRCGKRRVTLELQGRHCDIFHIIDGQVKRMQVDYSKVNTP